jgi:competence protein ComEC
MVIAQIFLYVCLAMIAGVGAASLIGISSFLFWLGAAMAALLFSWGLWTRSRKIAVAGIFFISFVIGFGRFDMVWRDGQNLQLAALGGKIGLIGGVIVNDPVFGKSSQQIIIKPDEIPGKILVLSRSYPEYAYGDRIEFSAKLELPQNFGSFDYQNYLAKDGIYSMVRYPEIKLVSRNNGNFIFSGLLWVKHKLKEGIGQALPAPHNSLLVAILLGDQSGLNSCSAKELEADPNCAKLKEELNISGLRHLAAVSGTHVTIMAGIVAPFLIWLGWWRQKALWATLVFLWLFIAMIGLPASAVRAGMMGSLMILAQIIGRPSDILRLVVIAAAFMVWQNPLIMRFDIGFQLSFLAVLGMACFAKPIKAKLVFIPKNSEFLRQALAITLAAQIFTLPILIYNFGYVSLYAPITNLLVEPMVPFITIYGFVLAIAAAISPALGWLLFFPIWLALSCLLAVANIFSLLPGAKLNFEINFIWLAISYIILAIIAKRVKESEKMENFI